MDYKIKSVGLVGYGYWGKNLARVFQELGVLAYILDSDAGRLDEARTQYPGKNFYPSVLAAGPNSIDGREHWDAIAIATPPETHFELVLEALRRGLHVFVEKPLTTDYDQALVLEGLAKDKGLTLAVGHIYLHCSGLQRITNLASQKEVYISLLNVEGAPSESTRDVLWAGYPHAFSILYHFLPDEPISLELGLRGKHGAQMRLEYWNGSRAFVDVRDFTGRRVREVEVRQGRARYVFDGDKPGQLLSYLPEPHFTGAGGEEPLRTGCEAFLMGKGSGDMGSKVVKAIEQRLKVTGLWK